MKNTFVKVLSFMMALTMIVGAFGAITVSAAACAHENRTETAVVAPTCATAGFTSYKCNDCGESFIDGIKNATGKHTWTNVAASAATCEDPAYSAHKKCSVCEAVEGKTATGAALGHAFNIPYTQAATCTEEGFTSKKCARCDKVDTDNKTNVVPAAHKYIYTVVTAPTACTSGSIKVTCSACDYNATIAQTEDHNWKDMSSSDAAAMLTKKNIVVGDNCNATYKSGKICIDCGAVKDTVAASKTHTYNFELGFDTITATNLTAELQALGFKVGDATKGEAATCVASSWKLGKCSICNTYAKVTVQVNEGKGHDWNNWGDTTPTDTDANHAVDKKQTRTCKNCDATETKVVKAASACVYTEEGAKVVTYPTCTENGYTTYKCDKCDKVTTGDVTFATGHAYGEWKYVAGYNCLTSDVTNAMVRTCGNKDKNNSNAVCGHAEYKNAEAKTAHKFVKETVAATCVDDAKYQNKCSDCGFIQAIDPATDAPAKGKNPNNHVVRATDTDKRVQEGVVAKTCTTKQKDRYLCDCGTLVDLEVGAAPAHTEGTEYTDKDGKVTSVAVKAPTCKEAGIKTAGKICTVCGVITKAPEVAPIDSTKHTVGGVFVDEGDATCVSKAYTTSYYSCCGIVHKIETGNVDETAHGAKLKTVAKVDATCTAKGVAAHQKCEACGLLWKADQTNLTKANAVTLASLATATADGDLVHDWNTTAVPEGPESCTTAGTKAYYTCKDCTTHIKVDGQIVCDDPATTDKNERDEALKIAAHGTKYMGWQTGKAPTCTEAGYRFSPVTDATKYYTESAYCCAKCDKITVAKTGHTDVVITNYNPVGGANYNCTLESYKVVECSVCKTTYFKEYAAAAKTAHEYTKYTEGDKKGQDKADVVGTPTCTTAAVDKYNCVNCKYVDERPGAAATGHAITVNGVSIKVSFACASADHKTYKGFKCSCGAELGKDSEHNIVTATAKAPTCTTTGNYEFDFCVDCGKVVNGSVVEIPATGHSAASTLISTENGINKYSCPVCGEYWTKAVDAVIVETLSAEKIAAGEVVTYTYAVTGKETFSSYDVVIPYDAYGLVFVGVEANADLAGLYAFASAGEYYYYDEDSDSGYYYDGVGVSLVVEYDAEGNEQFVETSADTTTVLFTLTFVASKTASGDAYIGDQDLEIVALGDLNGDEIVTAADAQAIFKFIGTNNVAADVNADGIVNLADVAALATFAASAKTVKDYLVMVDEFDKLEDVVFALFEAGKLNDINGDRVVNISDAYYFIATMNEEFADAPYEMLGYVLGNNDITMEALVNYLNVMISANGGR